VKWRGFGNIDGALNGITLFFVNSEVNLIIVAGYYEWTSCGTVKTHVNINNESGLLILYALRLINVMPSGLHYLSHYLTGFVSFF